MNIINSTNRRLKIASPDIFAHELAVLTIVLIGIMLLVAIYYVPAYYHSFLLDDYKHIEWSAAYLGKPWNIIKIFSPNETGWLYRPLQRVFFIVQRWTFGLNPAPYYLSLLLLHLINTTLLYALSRKLGVSSFGAAIAICLFALAAIHQDVLGWISSISLLLLGFFSLAAMLQMEIYLSSGRRRSRDLVFVVGWVLLALFSREEAIMLPLFLFIAWITATKTMTDMRKDEKVFWLILIALIMLYVAVLAIRPNWANQDDALASTNLAQLVSAKQMLQYVLDLTSRIAFIDPAIAGQGQLGGLSLAAACLFIYVIGLIRGNRAVRIGLLWSGISFAFIYVVVWREFVMANRYLYLPWIGLTLALGATLDPVFQNRISRSTFRAIVALLLVIIVSYQSAYGFDLQKTWQAYVDETTAIKKQVLEAYPHIDADTHFFAYNLPPVPDYIQSMASVWYGINLNSFGGSWDRLLRYGLATNKYFILSVEDGKLVNVMPELQDYKETAFIWDSMPKMEIITRDGQTLPIDPGAYALDQIVGPSAGYRLGMFMHPPSPDVGWASATFPVTIPNNSALAFATYKAWADVDSEDGMTFRVNFLPDDGAPITIFQESIDTPESTWRHHLVDVSGMSGRSGHMQFQVSANGNLLNDHGFWTMPRLVSGPLN